MDTANKRQLYRVIIKLMIILALLLVVGLFLSGVYRSTSNAEPKVSPQELSSVVLTVRSGQVQIIRLPHLEVSVLHRTPSMLAQIRRPLTTAIESPLDERLRSVMPEYFVYINKGAGIGCPLSLVSVPQANASEQTLIDTCTSQAYDLAGRPLSPSTHVPNLSVPAYHFTQDNQVTKIVIGAWQ